MKAGGASGAHGALSRMAEPTRLWGWTVVALSLFACGGLAALHAIGRHALDRTVAALDTVRHGRVDLANGFLHIALAGDSQSFDRGQGLALLAQALGAFEDAQGQLEEAGVPAGSLQRLAAEFQAALEDWRRTQANSLQAEAALRLAYFRLESQVDRIDRAARDRLRAFSADLDLWFLLTLAGAGAVLAGVCLVVIYAGRSRRAAEAARERAIEALREERDRLAKISATAPGALKSFRRGPDGAVSFPYASPRIADIYGLTPEELARDASAVFAKIHADDLARVVASVNASAASLTAWREEFRVRRPDGETIWVEARSMPMREPDGAVVWHGAIADVTERRAEQEALRESRESLRAIMAHTVDGLITIDEKGAILSFNAAAERMFGRSAEEAIGRHIRLLIKTPETSPPEASLTRLLASAGADGGAEAGQELEGLRQSGVAFPLDFAVAELPAAGGRRRFIATLRDLTHRKATAEQLRQAQKMEAVGQLTGGVAHDFNNLLSVIIGNLELIGEAAGDPERRRGLVERAMHAANRGAELTSRLLAFSRRQRLLPQRVEVNRLVEQLSRLLGRTLGETVEIRLELQEAAGAVTADAGQLENALLNLAVNARDAMPVGGRLIIRTGEAVLDEREAQTLEVRPGAYATIAVSDSGTGMTPETIERAFEPFFTTKEPGRGSGLGLSMVYGFVRQSGGHVTIRSEPGAGARVVLYLPRCAEDAPRDLEAGQERPAAPPRGGEAILLVEDDEDVRAVVLMMVTELGYRVIEARDAPSALAMLGEGAPADLLLSDVVLPSGMSGDRLAEEARKLRPGLPVLFMSGYMPDAQALERITAQGDALLPKPFAKAQVARALRQAFGRRAEAP